MTQVFVTGADGAEKEISGKDGESVMVAIRDNGFDELQALCGGSCACATCHVYIDALWLDRVGPAKGDEDDLLDGSDVRQANSRLSCQIELVPELEGLRVIIAPSD